MTLRHELPAVSLSIESEKPLDEYPQAELAEMTFYKGIEGVASTIVQEFGVSEEDLLAWMSHALDVAKQRLESKKG